MSKSANHHILKKFTENFYGVKIYCAYNYKLPTSITIDVIRSLNSGDHYLSEVLYETKNINDIYDMYDKVVPHTTVEYKHFTTMLAIIAEFETDQFTSDSDPLTPSWNLNAFQRYLEAGPNKAIETFKTHFPFCRKIEVDPPTFFCSDGDYDPINDFAKVGITLLGILN